MSHTIGQQLKHAREERRLTIEKVVEATHIRAHHIAAIEADDFESLPSPVQARAFLRLYAEHLGLSLDDVIERQRASAAEASATQADPEPAPVDPMILPPEPPAAPEPSPLQQTFSRLKARLIPPKPAAEEPIVEANEPQEPEEEIEPEPDAETPEPEAEAMPAEPAQSQVIFAVIGATLRQRRESLSLTLEEIERHTHVRRHYLQALESGEFERLPSSVQARGMLNNYAKFLDLDVDAVLLRFADGLQAQRIERQPKPEETVQSKAKSPLKVNLPPSLRRLLSVDILVGGGLVLLLVVFAFWGTSQIIKLSGNTTPQPTAPSISDILAGTPGEAATPSATAGAGSAAVIPAADTLVVTIPAGGTGAVQVVVVASQQAWVRVVVDGETEFEGRVEAGAAYAYDGETRIEVLTGDGSAIRILYNQSDLGQMGNFGEVVNRIYTANAILNPTPTSTMTPTITMTPTATLRPSATPRPSNTPRVSPTP